MALKAGGFKYERRDADAVKKRADQDGGNFDGILKSGTDTFRAKQGTNTVRFLPPTWEDPEHYGFDVWVHSYIGADSGTYICLKKMQDKHCPICDAAKEAADAGEEEEAKKMKAKKQVAAWVIDRDDKKPIPKVWIMSWSQDKDIASLCHSEKTGKVIMLDDPAKGYDLSFKRTGQQLNTRYSAYVVDREASELGESQKEENKILEHITEAPIPSLFVYKSADYLKKIVEGRTSKPDPDEDDAPPRRARGARDRGEPEAEIDDDPPPRRRRAAEPEPEDDDPPPRRRRAAAEPEDDDPPPRRRRAEPEPEDDDPPPRRRRAAAEEPEDEPEPPRRRRAAEPEDEIPDDPPPRRRRAEPEPEDDDPPPRRRRAAEPEPEDDPPPRRRRAEPEPEDDDPPPRRRRAAEPEPEDDPPARPRRQRA